MTYAGFIDSGAEGCRVHDWDQYIGRLLDKRRQDADRKRKERGQRSVSNGRPPDIRVTAQVTVPNRTGTGPDRTGDEDEGDARAAGAAPPTPIPKHEPLPAEVVAAFEARGLKHYPQEAVAEVDAARRLLRAGTADDLAECWQDIATGEYGDGWLQGQRSFVALTRHNRFGNWLAWKEQGKPAQGQARASPKANGQVSRQAFTSEELHRQMQEVFGS